MKKGQKKGGTNRGPYENGGGTPPFLARAGQHTLSSATHTERVCNRLAAAAGALQKRTKQESKTYIAS